MTLGVINNGVKDLGFGTTLSKSRPAGTIIDEIITLHRASKQDPNKPKVTLPRLENIGRISFEIEDIPIDICWDTHAYDHDDDNSWGDQFSINSIACLINPESPAAETDDELLTRTITKVMARILAKTSGLEIIAEMDYYHEAKEA